MGVNWFMRLKMVLFVLAAVALILQQWLVGLTIAGTLLYTNMAITHGKRVQAKLEAQRQAEAAADDRRKDFEYNDI